MQKILIVEDDIDIQDILKNHLIDAGYEVAVASDGVAGVARAAAAADDDCAFVSVCAGRDAGDGDAERFLPRYAIPVERDFALVDVCDADFLSGYDLAGGASGDFPFEPDVSAD